MTTEQKHTQEPWQYIGEEDGDFVIFSRGIEEEFVLNIGKSFITPVAVTDDPKNEVVGFDADKANARRIVACVNALWGIGTETLERYVMGGGKMMVHRFAALEAERDTLAAKVKKLEAQRDNLLLVAMALEVIARGTGFISDANATKNLIAKIEAEKKE
jgi:hypothetical protein